MAAMNFTQTERVLGKLTNGMKLVLVEVTGTSADVGAATVTVNSLRRIVGWTIGLGTPATDTFICADGAALLNTITITPSGDATGDILQILAVGV